MTKTKTDGTGVPNYLQVMADAYPEEAANCPKYVAELETHTGELITLSFDDENDVHEFVRGHEERYYRGQAGGPSGNPAVLIRKATVKNYLLRDEPRELDVSEANRAARKAALPKED